MANLLKRAVFSLIEKMVEEGEVAGSAAWSGTVHRIDLHLPSVDMQKWKNIQRLKCKVDEFEYRDYTPACWDMAKRTCSLYINTAHDGAGSRWAKRMQPGDTILFGAALASSLPVKAGRILCIGDSSAIGHFLSLRQLTDTQEYPLEATILLSRQDQPPAWFSAKHPEFEWLSQPTGDIAIWEKWLAAKNMADYTSICLAGNIPMVTALRKKLGALPGLQARVYAHGFWH